MTLNDRNRSDPDWSNNNDLPFEPAPIRRHFPHGDRNDTRRNLRRRAYNFCTLVVPSIVAAIYLYGFATPIYETDTVLSLRSSSSGSGGGTGFAGALALLSGGGSGLGRATDESFALVSNVRSREALSELDQVLDLRKRFQDPSINFLQRLPAEATSEEFYTYYGDYVTILYDEVTGQIILRTRAFDKELAFRMAEVIIRRGEDLVNQFNLRARNDLMQVASVEVSEAEERMRQADAAIMRFRQETGIMDPIVASQAIGSIIGTLMSEAAKLQAEITAEIQLSSGRATPQLEALRNKLKAVQAQIAFEEMRLTGQGDGLAKLLAPYQGLLTNQEIARQTYVAALAAQQAGFTEAKRQKLYLVNIVAPTVAGEARLPRRLRGVALTFLVSIGVWIGGRMLSSALRDHI